MLECQVMIILCLRSVHLKRSSHFAALSHTIPGGFYRKCISERERERNKQIHLNYNKFYHGRRNCVSVKAMNTYLFE